MVGTTISHYKILSKLGEGGMGVVYKAEDLRLGRIVALKFLATHLLANEEAKKRFVIEAKAAAALDHPNICTLYEIDEAQGRTFMAMAYLDGKTLETKIAEGPLKLDQAVAIAKQVAKGLTEAHSKGISHRDIKPSNVYLLKTSSEERLAKILDFGLARLAGQSQLTQQGTTLGTVAYMSPEQTQAAPVNHRTDFWALGVVLYEMIAGQRPFRGEYDRAVIYSIVSEQPEPITSLRTGVPMELEWIIGKALAKDPGRRYQTGIEIIVDLDTLETKLLAESSRMAAVAPGPVSQGFPTATREPTSSAAGPADAASAGREQTLRKRQVRDLILDLGSKGLLPDRILSQALDVISRLAHESSDGEAERTRLLDDLLYERVRVGEFIEQWHRLESQQEAPVIEEPGSKKRKKKKQKSRDVRSQAEIFGIPLCHRAWGKDPSTGKERIATGVFAFGNISVGLVACARWLAIGGVAISPISVGLWALGIIAIGHDAAGIFRLSLSELPFWQALLIVVTVALVGGFLLNRRKHRGPADQSRLDELALFSFREWRGHGALSQSGRMFAICGRSVVDLTEVQPVGESFSIDAYAVLGAIRIRTPEGWRVIIKGTPILGRFAVPTTSHSEQGRAGQCLVVNGTAILGSVQVEGRGGGATPSEGPHLK